MLSDLKYSILLPILIAFAISAILGPVIIPWLHKLKFGQYIREEGPKAHQKKSGTPTMGGIIFLLAAMGGISVFCQRLSEDRSGYVYYIGLWCDRISG